MLVLLALLSSPAQAGACNCGQEYYLARARGETDVKPSNPDECHEPEGGPGDLSCVMLDEWNPYANPTRDAEQRTKLEAVLDVAESQAVDDLGWKLLNAKMWRIPPDDPLHSRVVAFKPTSGSDAKTWDKASALVGTPGKLQELLWTDYCDGFRSTVAYHPHLNDMGPTPSVDRDKGRSNAVCPYGAEKPWLGWAWNSLSDPIDPDGLWVYTNDELVLVETMVAARHGAPVTGAAAEAFKEDPFKYSYKADAAYTDALLTEIDRQNLDKIKAYTAARKVDPDHASAVAAARATMPTDVQVAEAAEDSAACATVGFGSLGLSLLALMMTRRERKGDGTG